MIKPRMSLITPIRFLLFVAIVSLPSITVAQSNERTGQSTITGRVIFADTGRPVRRATLRLYTDLKLYPARTTAANINGEFRFGEVPAGSYFVVAEAPGVLSPRSAYAVNEFGIGSDAEMDQTQVKVDGKNSMRCEVRVVRAGTIRGSITYADKEPVLNGRIVLFRRKGGVVAPFFAEDETTNDRGMYRIDGLPDGEYFVGVVIAKKVFRNVPRSEQGSIPVAYYPGVASVFEAKPIQIQAGAEVAGINFTLSDDPLREISGVVKWKQNGKKIAGAVVILRRKDEPKVDLSLSTLYQTMARQEGDGGQFIRDVGLVARSFPPVVDTDKKGEWKFSDLTPGTYVITAFGSPPSNVKKAETTDGEVLDDDVFATELDESRVVIRQIDVTIADEDRKNITIELPESNRILGTVAVEGSEPIKVVIQVDQRGGNEFLMSIRHFSKEDGTFILEGIPSGEVILDSDVSGSGDHYLKSITLGSQDLLREPLVMNEGAEVTGVRVTVGQGLATLSGRVQFTEDSSPSAAAGILLVKADPKLWHLRSSRRFAMTNAFGEFKLTCAPGEYLVFTWAAGAQPFQSINEFVRMNASTARTISLQSKEEKQIELTVAKPKR